MKHKEENPARPQAQAASPAKRSPKPPSRPATPGKSAEPPAKRARKAPLRIDRNPELRIDHRPPATGHSSAIRNPHSAIEAAGQVPGIRQKLRKLAALTGKTRIAFPQTAASAHPFLTALLAREMRALLWVICPNIRVQEMMDAELAAWLPEEAIQTFPELTLAVYEGALPDPDIVAERLGVLRSLHEARGIPGKLAGNVILVSQESIHDSVPQPGAWGSSQRLLKPGTNLPHAGLITDLEAAGFERVPQVTERGQFSVRGGILDLFSWHMPLPARLEFFGDELESIREFEVNDQISISKLDRLVLQLRSLEEAPTCGLLEYARAGDALVLLEDPEARTHGRRLEPANLPAEATALPLIQLSPAPLVSGGNPAGGGANTPFHAFEAVDLRAGDIVLSEAKRAEFFRQLRQWQDEAWSILVFCNNQGEIERLQELLAADAQTATGDSRPPAAGPAVALDKIIFLEGRLARGFTFPEAKLAVLSDAEIFGRYQRNLPRRVRGPQRGSQHLRRTEINFNDLEDGDYVVHLEHGIAKFRGLTTKKFVNDIEQEVLNLEFAEGARLYVPLEHTHLISRYVGLTKRPPDLSELADKKWDKTKRQAFASIEDYASRMLKMQAERELGLGFAFPPDNQWQKEFEASFIYRETPDQLKAIADVKADMESERPMDRLICGDVGFGKTEVAIRAIFKAVMGGKQAAILVPTTVLAQQHFENFKERMSDYPITIELLSRYRSPQESREVLRKLALGQVDIVVGTHRLISKDVVFKNLGLVVIDEEQRFGVKHKDKFKELFALLDVMTLSATPIPRTLYLSLMGARDMSVIETPPPNRVPVETTICGYDERVIRDAIQKELARQGQVYFLHNRVYDIEKVKDRIQELVPGARVAIGHGQMDEDTLELVMRGFVEGRFDVLVSTTIIESGLDIPNANTIIIDRADMFGLADLYQLRGRVGRANNKAFAYLLLPRDLLTGLTASRRLGAIKEYSTLGAGFRIAMRDLEIRGSGNILGTAQSGQIAAVGFDLYCKMLRDAIDRMKGKRVRNPIDTLLRLDFVTTNEADYERLPAPERARLTPCFIPGSYMPTGPMRIEAYRLLAEPHNGKDIQKLRKQWKDRFGPPPIEVETLLTTTAIRVAAAHALVTIIETKGDKLMLTRGSDYVQINGKFPRLMETSGPAKLKEILEFLKEGVI